jgi:hypothetical protein
MKNELGFGAQQPQSFGCARPQTLRELLPLYDDHFDTENEALRSNKTVPWQTNLEATEA